MLDLFGKNEQPRISLFSHMVPNGIMQPLNGKIAIIEPFHDGFWIFFVQMNTKGSFLVQCGTQWNNTTLVKNCNNSAFSGLILDLFGTIT